MSNRYGEEGGGVGDLVNAPQDSLAGFLRRAGKGQENALQVIKQMLPDGKGEKVTVALQNRELQPELPPEPALARSPRRAHVFHTVEAAAAFINTYGSTQTSVLADVAERSAKIVLEEVAEGGFEVLTFAPQPHPLFLRWEAVVEKTISLLAFAKFVLFNRAQVTDPEGRSLALLLRQLRVSNSITAYSGMGAEAINGVTVTTSVEATQRTEQLTLPDQITILLPLFVATEPVPVTLDLTIDPRAGEGHEDVGIHIAAPELLDALCLVFQGMVEKLAEACGRANPSVVGLGTVAHEPWEVVRKQ